jgi:hypothetical protein
MLNLWTNKRRILPLLAILAGTQACFEMNDFNVERFAGVKVNPSVAIPLAHGSLAIEDLLPPEESPYIHYDEDHLVHILYSDTLHSTSIRDLFLLPQLKLNKFYKEDLSTTLNSQEDQVVKKDRQEFDFGFPEARFDEIHLKEGQLNITVSSNIDADLVLELNCPTLEKDGQALTSTLTLPASSTTQTAQVNLQGYTADFSDYEKGHNLLPVDITVIAKTNEPGILANVDNYVYVNLELNKLDFSLLKGYFGQREVQLPANRIPLTVFQTIFSKAEFNMKEPKLSFDLHSSNGVPIQAKTDLLQVGRYDGATVPIDISPASPFNISYPTEPGETAITSLMINNAAEAFALNPDFLDYQLTGRLNVGEIENVNFLTGDSKVAAIMRADIPLWGYLKGLTLSDTLEFPLQTEDAQVEEITFRTNVTNEFPLGVDLQVYFLGQHGELLDSLFDGSIPQLIKPSQVDLQGELSSPGILSQDILVSSTRIERILQSQKMVIKGTLYTSRTANGSHPDVKIKANHRLDVNLGVKTNMKISVKL